MSQRFMPHCIDKAKGRTSGTNQIIWERPSEVVSERRPAYKEALKAYRNLNDRRHGLKDRGYPPRHRVLDAEGTEGRPGSNLGVERRERVQYGGVVA